MKDKKKLILTALTKGKVITKDLKVGKNLLLEGISLKKDSIKPFMTSLSLVISLEPKSIDGRRNKNKNKWAEDRIKATIKK